jgi:hypothetical protein
MAAKKNDVDLWDSQQSVALKAISNYINLPFVEKKCSGWRDGALDVMEMRAFWRFMVLGLWIRESAAAIGFQG